MNALRISAPGPGLSVQDLGRPGHLSQGLSRGGAADRLALVEAAVLLNLPAPVAAIEMALMGARFQVDAPTRIALTGAEMSAQLNDAPLIWNASHLIRPGDTLVIGPARAGCYGYLTPAGGIATPQIMDSRATHFAAGIGGALRDGDCLPLDDDPAPDAAPQRLSPDDRLSGGTLRIMPGPQTDLFTDETRARFYATPFMRGTTGNRQGVRLDHDGAPFGHQAQSLASDLIVPGDVQMTGDGIPYVLMAECQTMGGYPRIGSVIPADLPRLAQATPGTKLRFTPITVEEAQTATLSQKAERQAISARLTPMIRDPHDIADLLSYQLISGATRGDDL